MNVQKLNQQEITNTSTLECGNCWGHQEWNGDINDKTVRRTDKSLDGFILKFIKKYL